ncbi:hypothetical protein ACFQGT_12965 [Natrialbaceae archaeon GCM10025810]|uniref:hypothetical protein n=1 Tax=Halovalidus salilacus TaxID=3075124 RepID=UPI00361BCBEF
MATTDSEPIQWRRDASTSRSVRLLWSLGVGTFFAAITIVVFWRLYDMARVTVGLAGQGILVAVVGAIVVTILAVAALGRPERTAARLLGPLPIDPPEGRRLERAIDAALGAVAMASVMVALMAIGRYVSQHDLLAVGAGPFTGLTALFIPLALVALVLSSFLRSVGTLDREERRIYLHQPDEVVDLDLIEDVSISRVGDAAVLKLEYAQPDGQYVPGPRRLVVPPAVAREIAGIVRST